MLHLPLRVSAFQTSLMDASALLTTFSQRLGNNLKMVNFYYFRKKYIVDFSVLKQIVKFFSEKLSGEKYFYFCRV